MPKEVVESMVNSGNSADSESMSMKISSVVSLCSTLSQLSNNLHSFTCEWEHQKSWSDEFAKNCLNSILGTTKGNFFKLERKMLNGFRTLAVPKTQKKLDLTKFSHSIDKHRHHGVALGSFD